MNDEGAARIRALVQAISDLGVALPEARALDLGAGDGEIAVELALRGASVVAVEVGRRTRRTSERCRRTAAWPSR